jgi:hypothetical protein
MVTVMRAVLAGSIAAAVGAIVAVGTFVVVMPMTRPDCPRNDGSYRSLIACVWRPQGPMALAVVLGVIAVAVTAFALRRWLLRRPDGGVR